MGSLRVVVDTNVIVSALGFGGRPLEALLQTFDDDRQLIASEETLSELERVMDYEHLPFTRTERIQYPTLLRLEAEIVDPEDSITRVRDADDDKFLECAIEGDAEYLVSGDEDLLDLQSYEGVDIVTPDEFVEIVE